MVVILSYFMAFLIGIGITIAIVGDALIGGLLFTFISALLFLGANSPGV